MTGLEEGERPNGNSSCALSRLARALKFCMGTNSDPLFHLVKSDSFFGNVLIPFKLSWKRGLKRGITMTRVYKKQFEHSMAVIEKVNSLKKSVKTFSSQTGTPDLFVTFTGNPKWKEIEV